jgi:hypothetical protein
VLQQPFLLLLPPGVLDREVDGSKNLADRQLF